MYDSTTTTTSTSTFPLTTLPNILTTPVLPDPLPPSRDDIPLTTDKVDRLEECIIMDTDFVGNDIISGECESYEECHDLCRSHPICEAWSYIPSVPTQCWLKTKTGFRLTKEGSVSGTKDCSYSRDCHVNDTDYVGHNIDGYDYVTSYRQCLWMCKQNEECMFFSFNPDDRVKCLLKRNVGRRSFKPGSISGCRTCQ
ncbi:MAG: uncharacterized protein KVP18_003338 [Porospora cf. gigantea A]|nr:MAG: hypothetical protein KVP18_003338 [Porospora cf. gigantea A]